MSSIDLTDPGQITQLYEHLELFSMDDPPRHTLFVLGRQPHTQVDPVQDLIQMDAGREQLLLIDPPADAMTRFRLDGDVAALFTGPTIDMDIPVMATQPGGVAHVRIGEHFLDVYTQRSGSVVHLPALGIICSGGFGSDVTVPQIAEGSDGGEELDTLRLLAHLVKRARLQLLIPHVGGLVADVVEAMKRLAADVAYLHGLRRVVPAAVQRGDSLEDLLAFADTLLPEARRPRLSEGIHLENLQVLYEVNVRKHTATR